MRVKRCWTYTKNAGILEVWDGGSKRYERWSDGTEHCWEVLERTFLSDTSYTEILRELPSWNTPATVMWTEQVKDWTFTVSNVHEDKPRPQHHEQTRQIPKQPNQPANRGNQNVNRRHFHSKKPHTVNPGGPRGPPQGPGGPPQR